MCTVTISGIRSKQTIECSQNQGNFRWMPGQTLPEGTHRVEDAINPPRPHVLGVPGHDDMFDMMQQFQGSMVSQLEKVCSKLDNIDTRMVALETRQKSLEEEVHLAGATNTATSIAETGQNSQRRKRVTPSDLQVSEYVLYTCLPLVYRALYPGLALSH